MGSLLLKRVAVSVHRILNSSSPPQSTTLLRPVFGYYYRASPFTSHTDSNNNVNDIHSLHIDLSNEESKRTLFNRLLYRSKQRGFLELDLVLGKWVQNNIHSLDENHIRSLIHLLDVENPDLWKWLSGQEQPPESISMNPVFNAVREGVMKNLDSHSSPETRATPGQPWVRGWDDIQKFRGGPSAGNQ